MIRHNLFLAVLICMAGAAAGTSNGSDQSNTPISISISAPQTTVTAGSEVRIDILLRNTSDKAITLEETGTLPYKIEVRGLDGNLSAETEHGRTLREMQDHERKGEVIHARVGLTLKPGETIKQQAVVSDFYDMTHPDEYSIQMSRLWRGAEVKSNTLKVTITP